jgi:anti-anti-sigma factor
MRISARRVGEVTILDLDGRLISDDGFEPLREKLSEVIGDGETKVLLNFDRVSYLDSAGIGLIACKYVTMKRLGGQLKLCNLRPRTHDILNITGLLKVFESFTTEEEALEHF